MWNGQLSTPAPGYSGFAVPLAIRVPITLRSWLSTVFRQIRRCGTLAELTAAIGDWRLPPQVMFQGDEMRPQTHSPGLFC